MFKTANDVNAMQSKSGKLVRFTGNPAEIALQIPEEDRAEFFSMLEKEAIELVRSKNTPCMLYCNENRTWPQPLRELKEREGFSWSCFNGYLISCRELLWPEVDYSPKPLVL